jgi:hypothetical protein
MLLVASDLSSHRPVTGLFQDNHFISSQLATYTEVFVYIDSSEYSYFNISLSQQFGWLIA